MTRIFLTIYEPTAQRALSAIAAAPGDVDGIEIRFDRMVDAEVVELEEFRKATDKPLLFTKRSLDSKPKPMPADELERALEVGFDLVDVEFHPSLDRNVIKRYKDRIVVSHHDFTRVPDLEPLISSMKALSAEHIKIAVTPHTLEDNERILAAMQDWGSARRGIHLTLFGMGEAGLYSRILAPMYGSEITFVARDAASIAAPGQLTIDDAREIYRQPGGHVTEPKCIFAVIGNPVGHSRSPRIHNRRFHSERIRAAYSALVPDDLDSLFTRFTDDPGPFVPTGMSVTAPFKERAFQFAESQLRRGSRLTIAASEARSVNTLVRFPLDKSERVADERFRIVADNTDVEGFAAALRRLQGRTHAALIGAGGTARAALVALRSAEMKTTTTLYNRTYSRGVDLAREFDVQCQPLSTLKDFGGDLIINTVSSEAGLDIPVAFWDRHCALVDVTYGRTSPSATAAAKAGCEVFGGAEFLEAQAEKQSKHFIAAAKAWGA